MGTRGNKPEIIFLCGFSGSGKTEMGENLAQKLNYAFTDTDSVIEEHMGKTIPEIFARFGEAKFRFAENDAIRMACMNRPQVIALGGGAIHDKYMLEYIKSNGYLIYLRTTPETIYNRLQDSHIRPMLQVLHKDEEPDENKVMERIKQLLNEREEIYLGADKVIDTENKSCEDIAREINNIWGNDDK
ncbi:MAG: shikimate kinase [candidate division Zixibacteria bacterium]